MIAEEPGIMSVEETGELRERFGYRAVIVVGVREDGTVDVMSHARDRADCRVIGDYAQGQFGANLPRAPFQTWFGWGNGGVPLALSKEQLAELGNYGQRYVATNTHPDAYAAETANVTPPEILKALGAAVMALRSYQYGNAATDLAKGVADASEAVLRDVGFPPGTAASA